MVRTFDEILQFKHDYQQILYSRAQSLFAALNCEQDVESFSTDGDAPVPADGARGDSPRNLLSPLPISSTRDMLDAQLFAEERDFRPCLGAGSGYQRLGERCVLLGCNWLCLEDAGKASVLALHASSHADVVVFGRWDEILSLKRTLT